MPRIILVAAALTALLAFLDYCTLDVASPNVTVDCVEIVYPGLQTKQCADAGTQSSPPPRDGGSDSREQ